MRLCPIKYGVKQDVDPYAAYVISLLRMDGTNNQTTNFTDEITGTGAWATNETLLRTASAKFGTTGFLQGSSWLGAPEYITAQVGSKSITGWGDESNWTQEGWWRYDAGVIGSQGFTFFALRQELTQGTYISVSNVGSGRIMYLNSGGSSVSTGIAVPSDTHHFFQMISNGTSVVFAMDGVQIASLSITATISPNLVKWEPAHNVYLGGQVASGDWDELRLTKGVARAVSLPTGAFPNP